MNLNGTGGDVLLLSYIVGGLATIGSGLLPGSSKGWRIFSIIAGAVMAVWAAYVLMFGGWIIISFKILIMPVLLIIRGIRDAVRKRKESTQPQFQAAGAPGQPFPPAPQGGFPQGGYPPPQPGYAPQPQGGYPAPQSAPPMQGGYPAPQPGYAPQPQGGYPAPQPGYAPQPQGGYPAPGYGAPQMPPVQPGYAPPAQPGYYAPPSAPQGYQPPAN